MYLVKTPPIIKTLFPDFIWHVETDEPRVFLTFDDGPIPGLTPWILDELSNYNFKATFFCVGENAARYPELVDQVLSEGHLLGNHTHNHLNGWLTDRDTYLANVEACDQVISTTLFRPPYGKIRRSQFHAIRSEKSVIMWDVLSGDFDPSISNEKCLSNVIDHYSPGSIIVFHDNLKSEKKLRYVLPRFLDHLAENSFVSENLECMMMDLV
jgi:peptidoglycan/xylan/chitin deacetylase (PgdA/CDA1 family)